MEGSLQGGIRLLTSAATVYRRFVRSRKYPGLEFSSAFGTSNTGAIPVCIQATRERCADSLNACLPIISRDHRADQPSVLLRESTRLAKEPLAENYFFPGVRARRKAASYAAGNLTGVPSADHQRGVSV